MNQTGVIVRAIGAEYVRRFIKPVMIISAVAISLLLVFGGWLTTVSSWWWILEIVFIGIALLALLISVIVRTVIRITDTAQTKDQKTAVNAYVDKLERIAENIQTPQPIILIRVVKDIIRPSSNGIIQSMSRDTRSLAPDYSVLTQRF